MKKLPLEYQMVRELPKIFHKNGGGGFRSNPKVLGHFLCTIFFKILVSKGGVVT